MQIAVSLMSFHILFIEIFKLLFTCHLRTADELNPVSLLDASVRKKRKKYGGSGRKLFTEGWIEFKDKSIAKAVALSLNNTSIGKYV